MKRLKTFLRCRRASTAIEFALAAPLLFSFLFGIIETSRVFWIKQTLDEVAYHTARCMSVSSTCDTTASQKAYAVSRATSYGIVITAADVTISSATTCKGNPGSNAVTIAKATNSPIGMVFPNMPGTLTARACYPVVS